jgi:hypothetical protein
MTEHFRELAAPDPWAEGRSMREFGAALDYIDSGSTAPTS